MNRKMGGNSKIYRQLNRGLILRLIATNACVSRADLARSTGLTKMAVTNIVTEMMEQHLVEERSAVLNDEVGRNPIRLQISDKCPKAAGVLILRDRVEVVLCDLNLNILSRRVRTMKAIRDCQSLYLNIYEMLDEIFETKESVLGIGIAAIGPVDVKNGVILEPLYFWGKNIPIVQYLKKRYELPVFLNHDNQCGALAELLFGSGKSCRDFLFLGLGQGIGCGMVFNGELYENQEGLAAEIGHTSIDYHGPVCSCGNRGCIECYVSTSVIEAELVKSAGVNLNFYEFCGHYQEAEVGRVFREAVMKMGAALVNHVNLLNPKLISLGNDGVYWPEECVELLEKEVNRLRYFRKSPPIEIQKTGFGEDAQLLGAACLVIQEGFLGRLLFS